MNAITFIVLSLVTTAPAPDWHWSFDTSDGSGPSPARLQPDADLVNDVECGGRSVVVSDFANAAVDLGVEPGQFGTGDFTVSLWFKTDSTNYNNELLSNRASGSHGVFFNLRFTNSDAYGHGALVFEVDEDGFGYMVVGSREGLNDDRWHHVIARRVGDVVSMTVDGKTRTERSRGVANIVNGVPLMIGSSAVAGEYGLYFRGTIDDVRIWHSAVNDAAIAATRCAKRARPQS